MRIQSSGKFDKSYRKADDTIKVAVEGRLRLFVQDPFYPQLNNHSLKGKYRNYRSINITGDWRALYTEQVSEDGKKIIIFELLGTHSMLYK